MLQVHILMCARLLCRQGEQPANGADDVAFARNVQREEYRAHLRGMLDMLSRTAGQQHVGAGANVEHMSYEELQELGDIVGKVKVR